MSYLTEQKTELAQAQVTEALLRMSKLQIHSNTIKEFLESGKLNRSERGILYWLEQDEEKMVREWEKETGNMVYHVIKDNTEIGLLYTFLYVSDDTEDWEEDREDIENNIAFTYVKNATIDYCSEYGTVGIMPLWGGGKNSIRKNARQEKGGFSPFRFFLTVRKKVVLSHIKHLTLYAQSSIISIKIGKEYRHGI